MDETVSVDDASDAGDMSCGELVFRLALRMRELRPGAVLKLTATDLGAPHDIPAWCRMTGHALVRAEHPHYLVRRKDS
jgi:tRNA 2-thiouridine synthesizing protein A